MTRPLFARDPMTDGTFNGESAGQTEPPRRPWQARLAAGLLRRLLLAPVVLAVVMAMLVYGTTHRPWLLRPSDDLPMTPARVKVFYREVRLATSDGVSLAGWHVPAWSAEDLIRNCDRQLRQRRPGLVVCHGAWADRSQMLHLVPALHAAGYELLLVDLRGCGQSGGRVALGLEEWQDIQAAIAWLQRVSSVDPQRIGLIASDANVSAALRAAANNPAVGAVAADRPCRSVGSFVSQRFRALGLPGGALGRLYEWSFALCQLADSSQASAQRWAGALTDQQALLVAARNPDRFVAPGDPPKVLSQARGRRVLRLTAFPAEPAGQPALIPADVVKFFNEHLGMPAVPDRPVPAGRA